jgi:hypothetical protein
MLYTLLSFTGMLACSLGQCMAGFCTTFNTFIVCQGLVFGVGKHPHVLPYILHDLANLSRPRTRKESQKAIPYRFYLGSLNSSS